MSQLGPKQVFDFVGYQNYLKKDGVKIHTQRQRDPQIKGKEFSQSSLTAHVLPGLLKATEMQVCLGYLRPIRLHNYNVPESVDKVVLTLTRTAATDFPGMEGSYLVLQERPIRLLLSCEKCSIVMDSIWRHTINLHSYLCLFMMFYLV